MLIDSDRHWRNDAPITGAMNYRLGIASRLRVDYRSTLTRVLRPTGYSKAPCFIFQPYYNHLHFDSHRMLYEDRILSTNHGLSDKTSTV
jgi:hypothetical protein